MRQSTLVTPEDPLINDNGIVIGINTAAEIGATGADGIGFAIPSNLAAKLLPDLIAGKTVTRPWLGISGTALTQETASNGAMCKSGCVCRERCR